MSAFKLKLVMSTLCHTEEDTVLGYNISHSLADLDLTGVFDPELNVQRLSTL